jgi:trehalose utilization protein
MGWKRKERERCWIALVGHRIAAGAGEVEVIKRRSTREKVIK